MTEGLDPIRRLAGAPSWVVLAQLGARGHVVQLEHPRVTVDAPTVEGHPPAALLEAPRTDHQSIALDLARSAIGVQHQRERDGIRGTAGIGKQREPSHGVMVGRERGLLESALALEGNGVNHAAVSRGDANRPVGIRGCGDVANRSGVPLGLRVRSVSADEQAEHTERAGEHARTADHGVE